MDGEAIFFTGRGRAGEARPKIYGAGRGRELKLSIDVQNSI